MRVVPINEAEAVIETFFNLRESVDPSGGNGRLDHYRITTDDTRAGSGAFIRWHALAVNLQTPGASLMLERDCDLCIADYDILRLFASVTSDLSMTITAVIDGETRVLADGIVGTDTTEDHDFSLSGERMTQISLRLTLVGERPSQAELSWIGLSNRARQEAMLSRPSPYDAVWTDMLRESGEFEPQLGIYFDKDGLSEIRRKVKGGYLSDLYTQMLRGAQADMQLEPEKQIGTFMGLCDRRWLLTRDMGKQDFSHKMERLAFVGMVEENAEMCRMAARMALSAAHCTYWSESFMGAFPGSTWHHVAFTEEVYCAGCSAVLDWAGDFLTPYGKAVIRDAIMMKGLPRIEASFRTSEYIRTMNQGIVFSGGRIRGLLALVQRYPRYRVLLEEAERDLLEMIEYYVRPDGGCEEGPGYWHYSMTHALPLLYMLARYHGKTLQEYAPESVKRCGAYACQMLSVQGTGAATICVNDSHMTIGTMGTQLSPGLLSLLWRLTGEEPYRRLLSDAVHGMKGQVYVDFALLITAPEELPPTPRYIPFGMSTMNVVGQTHIVRQGKHRITNLHLTSGSASAGHAHEDKGGFVLETDRETLAIDRGAAWYAHPESALMQRAVSHNLLLPERDGVILRQRHDTDARMLDIAYKNDIFCYATETQAVWRDEPFTLSARRIVSPTAEVFVVDDEVCCTAPTRLHFAVNSSFAAIAENGGMRIEGEYNDLFLCPLNWAPASMTSEEHGVDSKLRTAYLTRLTCDAETEARLLTAMIILEKDEPAPVVENGVLQHHGLTLATETSPRGLTVTVNEHAVTFAADVWTIQ